jgi:N-acetylglucosaminyl-diphospho-decaprenol L-rhamnosyltransferase
VTSVSVVIAHYRQPDVLEACVRSIVDCGDSVDEIVVVDSGSIEPLEPMLDKLADKSLIKVVTSIDNIGYGRAINAGVAHSTGDVLVCLNADTQITPGAIAQLVATLQDETIGLAGALLVDDSGMRRDSAFHFHHWDTIAARRTPYGKTTRGRAELERFRYDDATYDAPIADVDWVVGAAWAMTRTTWHEVGGFDPRFFMYFEDVDLSRRVHESGKRVVVASRAVIRHDEGGASRASSLRQQITNPMTRAHAQSAAKYFWKWR